MTVKQLINELLNVPMDSEIQIAYVDENYEYEYQDIMNVVYYEEDDMVGLIGAR